MGAGPLPKTVGQVWQTSHMERSRLGVCSRSIRGSTGGKPSRRRGCTAQPNPPKQARVQVRPYRPAHIRVCAGGLIGLPYVLRQNGSAHVCMTWPPLQ